MKRLALTRDTVGTVARGHPWVYRDGVRGSAAAGEPVLLVDDRSRAVAWGLFEQGTVAVRVLGREPQPLPSLLRSRLRRAWEARRDIDADAFRACNGEGDLLGGLVVDRYGPVLVVRLYSAAWEPHLDEIVGALVEVAAPTTVYRRFGVERVDGREGGETLHGPPPPDELVVTEHGMRLLARVLTGQKTGLFLDQREHRRRVRGWARDRSVVNLFSYNGGFSVAAALGGATRVVSVDVAPAAIEDARANFRLNGIDPGRHGFEVADAFTWRSAPVDFVVCDPPSLARHQDAEANARRAYRDLHRHVAPLARELLATSSCTARISWDRWEEAVRDGLPAGWARRYAGTEPEDHPVLLHHPEGRYLKFLLLGRPG